MGTGRRSSYQAWAKDPGPAINVSEIAGESFQPEQEESQD
jgi:hypothetical protein